MTLLAVDDITVTYGRLTALRGVTLKIAEGEVLFVTGPNGAGKSTLLNAIAGVVPAGSGSITMDGAKVTGASPEDIARRGFSLVPECEPTGTRSPATWSPSTPNSRCWPIAGTRRPACSPAASSRCSSSVAR
jgi:ABC-type cobalamin/Fe3+-siderophores transport system ATPase subunit